MGALTVNRSLLLAVLRVEMGVGSGEWGEPLSNLFELARAGPIDGFSGESSNRIICRLNI